MVACSQIAGTLSCHGVNKSYAVQLLKPGSNHAPLIEIKFCWFNRYIQLFASGYRTIRTVKILEKNTNYNFYINSSQAIACNMQNVSYFFYLTCRKNYFNKHNTKRQSTRYFGYVTSTHLRSMNRPRMRWRTVLTMIRLRVRLRHRILLYESLSLRYLLLLALGCSFHGIVTLSSLPILKLYLSA